MLRLIILLSSLSHTIRKFRCDLLSIQYGNLLTLGHPVYFGNDDDGDFFAMQMRDIGSNVHHTEDNYDCALNDNETSRIEQEKCRQLQQENDLLQEQLAEASLRDNYNNKENLPFCFSSCQ